MTPRAAASWIGFAAFLLCGLLFAYYPAVPHSFLGWVALVGLGLPAWVFVEWLGTAVLGSRIFAARSSVFRIAVGVPIVLVLIAVVVVCVRFVQAAVLAA